jgi:hypothetical protein
MAEDGIRAGGGLISWRIQRSLVQCAGGDPKRLESGMGGGGGAGEEDEFEGPGEFG